MPSRALPEPISVALTRILVGGRGQIAVMAATVGVVAGFSNAFVGGWLVVALAAYTEILLVKRFFLMDIGKWGTAPPISAGESYAWLKRYQSLLLQYGAAVGAMNATAVFNGDWMTRLIVVAEIFGLCAGQVSRNSSSPKLCATVVLLAAVPTGLAFLAIVPSIEILRFALAAICIGLMIIAYAVTSLGVIAFNYRTILSHLEAKHHLAGVARRDDLTGLPNRLALREDLQAAIVNTAGRASSVALHMIDLDGFKEVNDTHGHPSGDQLLRAVAERIVDCVRGNDVAYRLGGDEFAVIQHDVTSRHEIEFLGRRIVKALSEPFHLQGAQVRIGASDGTAIATVDAQECDALLELADQALYQSKAAGRGTVTAWRPAIEAVAVSRAA